MGNYLLEGSADPAGKLISAADTADVHQSLAAGHPQQGAAGGTLEEYMGLSLLQVCPLFGKGAAVFSLPFQKLRIF